MYTLEFHTAVTRFIVTTPHFTQARILRELELLEQYGRSLPMPHSKKVTKQLFELRVRGKQHVRLLYCFIEQRILVIHGFIKKSNAIPVKEIRTATQRMQLLLE